MEKTKLQEEWDKIKESNLIKIKTIQKKYIKQLLILKHEDFRHTKHIVVGWYLEDSFDNVIIKDVTTSRIFRMPIWAYVEGVIRDTEYKFQGDEMNERASMEKMVRETFDQIFI